MSSNVKNCHNIHNIVETSNNCEAYMSRLFRKDKLPQVTGNKSNSNPNPALSKFKSPSAPRSGSNSAKSKQVQRPTNNPPGKSELKSSNAGETNTNTVHKELYTDNSALVEVTVKTSKPRQRPNAASEREPWGKLLQSHGSDKASTFSSFDPLRTLHFLAKELQYKLQSDLPDDNNLQQMVNDMQNALKRVPPEIASTIQLQQSNEAIPLRKSSSSNSMVQKTEKLPTIRPLSTEKGSQTLQKTDDAELLQKIMEDSTLKLEASCRQMEMLCGRLKSEKDDLEEQLKIEKDNVKFLKKRVGDLEIQSEQLVSVTIKRLEEEKNELQVQVNKLTDVVDTQSMHTNLELKNVSQELRTVKARADQECTKLKHQLTLANMEKEKYIAILTVRDRQIGEIRAEMSQLQDVVNEQLMDIHNTALSELPSTNSIGNEDVWNGQFENKENVIKDGGENSISTINTNSEEPNHPLTNKPASTSFKELPSGDSTVILQEVPDNYHEGMTIKQNGKASPRPKDHTDKKQSIRDMFAELKKQAFAINSKTVIKP